MQWLLAFAAEFWWIAPAAVGTGAAGWAGLRATRRLRPASARPMPRAAARRLELDASRHELLDARSTMTRARAELRVAQAELLRVEADRAAARAPAGAVPEARRRVQAARNEVKAATAAIRARRAAVSAARATLPDARTDRDDFPLGRLMAEHDALTARWMVYETDPARAIAYPAMTDVRSPLLAHFLAEEQQARWLRPRTIDATMTPADFAAYRAAVRRAAQAFEAAERDALRRAGHPIPPAPGAQADSWIDLAQDVLARTQRTVDWSIKTFQRRPGSGRSEPPAS